MARAFSGTSSDLVNCGASSVLGFSPPGSVSAWFKVNAFSGAENIICVKENTGPVYYGLSIRGAPQVLGAVFDGGSLTGVTTPVIGAWYHGAFSLTGGSATLYLNGSVEAGPAATSWTNPTTGNFQIGFNSLFTNGLNGSIADVAVWNVGLTATEMASLAKGVRPGVVRPKSLIGWWPLDGLASPEPDLSGNKNNGTLTGTSSAFGPPFTLYTPRWPQFAPAFVAPTSILWAQSAM